jgi:PPK2 family polyphosphate:nucleotide phosphotransferase
MSPEDLERRYRVVAERFSLADHDPRDTAGLDHEAACALRVADLERLGELQHRLFTEGRRALLVVFQGLDAAGKDGTIARVIGAMRPQGVRVTSYKSPTSAELAHDWLWRHVVALPERGQVGVFNRSHYEEVVVTRVHAEQLAAEAIDPSVARDERFWQQRLQTIVAWERHLDASGTRVVKFFLHVSREEQRRRLLARARDPEKRWKFVSADVTERAHWDAYHAAHDAALRATSTEAAPWYVIPADHKWLLRTAVARVLVHHLEQMDPRFPEPDDTWKQAAAKAIKALVAEGGPECRP